MDVTLDNIIFGLQSHGGISVYWSEILKRGAHEGVTWIDPDSALSNLSRQLLPLELRLENPFLPLIINRYARVACSTGILHSSYYRIAKSQKTKLVTTVYDFTYERFRHGPARWVHQKQKMAAINRSDAIICISESTARDVVNFGGKDLTAKIKVTHLGASDDFKVFPGARTKLHSIYPWLEPVLAQKKIILFVGARTNYKRFDLAVHAIEKEPELHLVVIGGGLATPTELKMTHELFAKRQIHFIPKVPASELPLWYNVAFALLYLSEYEGFGLPVIEAARCRCPVIAQNSSSIPELYGDHAFLLPLSAGIYDIKERFRALENQLNRNQLIEACLQRARTFSWEKCWEETKGIYQQL
jgi:mannosyltransferase